MVRTVKATLQDNWCTSGLLVVIGPTNKGKSRQEFTSKGDLERACTEEAGRRFTQAADTPMLTDPLLHLFGKTGGHSASFKQVLAGTFHPPAICNQVATRLLQFLYHLAQVADCPP